MRETDLTRKRVCLVVWMMAIIIIPALNPSKVHAVEGDRPMGLQLMLGKMVMANDDPKISGSDYDITLGGVAVQAPFAGTTAQAGLEVGALLNWDSETRSFTASGGGGGGSLVVAVDINQFLVDFFFGGYVSIQPIKWLRLYLGAGPLLIYASRETEENDPVTTHSEKKSESAFGVGVYGRTGIDIVFSKQFSIGMGVRATQNGVTLNDTAGKVDVEGWQYFGVLSFRF